MIKLMAIKSKINFRPCGQIFSTFYPPPKTNITYDRGLFTS